MILTIDTSVPLTSQEKLILLTLLGEASPKASTEAEKAAPAPRTEKVAPAETEDKPPTVEDAARLAAQVFAMRGGREYGRSILKGLEVEKVRDLSPEQAIDFHEKLTAWKAEQGE